MAKILIVDDDPDILTFASKCLEEDHDIFTATGGNQALRLAEGTSFDVVITDILMPNKDGLEVIRELKAAYPQMAVIAFSAGLTSSRLNVLKAAEALGAQRTLSKPFTAAQLQDCVREALES
jgi:CheY-like chemotaxis protein